MYPDRQPGSGVEKMAPVAMAGTCRLVAAP